MSEDVIAVVLPHTNEQGIPVAVKCLSVSPAGNLIAAGCNDGAVRVWAYSDVGDRRHNTRGSHNKGGEVYRRQAPRVAPPQALPAGGPGRLEAIAGAVPAGVPVELAGASERGAPGLATSQDSLATGRNSQAQAERSGGRGGSSTRRSAGVARGGMGAVVGAVIGDDLPGMGGDGSRRGDEATASNSGGRSGQHSSAGRAQGDGSGSNAGGAASSGRGGSGVGDGVNPGHDEGLIEVRLATKLFGESVDILCDSLE